MDAMMIQLARLFENGAILLALPALWLCFVAVFVMRWAMHAKVRGQYRFLAEVERRVHRRFADPQRARTAFAVLVKDLFSGALDAFYSTKKHGDGRRKLSRSARYFRMKETSATLVADVIEEGSGWHAGAEPPRFMETARFILGANRGVAMVGPFSLGGCHRFLNATPALFLLTGAVLTMLGIVSVGMPGFDAAAASTEQAVTALRAVLDRLPYTLLFAASGIAQAAVMQLSNALLDPERVFVNAMNKLAGSLAVLWQDTVPAGAHVAHAPEGLESFPPPSLDEAPDRLPMSKRSEPVQELAPESDSEDSESTVNWDSQEGVEEVSEAVSEIAPEAEDRSIGPEERTFVGMLPRTQSAAPVARPGVRRDAVVPPPPPPAASTAPTASMTMAPAPSAVEEIGADSTGSWSSSTADGPPGMLSAPRPAPGWEAPRAAPNGGGTGTGATSPPELWGAPGDAPATEDRLAIVKHRLGVIEQYLEKAAEDRMHGLISEGMWQEESHRWTAEREKLMREAESLDARLHGRPAA